MTEASYTAWDDKQYVWPPPEGWYQASDNKWWPEGYGPPPGQVDTAGSGAVADGSAADPVADQASTSGSAEQTQPVDGATDNGDWTTDGSADGDPSSTDWSVGGVAPQSDWSAAAESGPVDGTEQASQIGFGEPGPEAGNEWSGLGTDAVADGEAGAGSISEAASIAGATAAAGSAGTAAFGAETETEGDAAPGEATRSILESTEDADRPGVESAGSGAFADAPMEMNDLSSFVEQAGVDPVADRLGGFGDFAAPDGLPDIDDVLPAERGDADASPQSVFGDAALPDAETPTLADVPIAETDGAAGLGGPNGPVGAIGPEGADGASAVLGGDFDPALAAGAAAAAAAAAAAGEADESVTQVVPTDLSAAPTEFASPPLVDDAFSAPAGDPSPSSFDSSGLGEAPPAADPFASPPAAGPGAFASPETSPPDGFPAPAAGFSGAPTGAESQLYGGATGPEIGLDSQELLDSKPKGGSRTVLLAAIGVLALVAICAALFLALRGDDESADTDAAASGGPGSVDQPHSLSTGVVVFYPDGDTDQRWVIEVLEPARDATGELASAAPATGNLFAATSIRVRNESGVDGASVGDLEFNSVTAAGEVIERSAKPCPPLANELDDTASVALGTGVEGGICWEAPAGALDGLMLGIESAKVSGRVHIALQ